MRTRIPVKLACIVMALTSAAGCAQQRAPIAESDERPNDVVTLALENGQRAELRDATLTIAGHARLRDVVDAVAVPGGRVLAQRSTDIGQSDLWLVDATDRATPPRALAAARGADALPLVTSGDVVLFVSDRTGVASIWRVQLDGRELRQLTNVGERVGALTARFVPSPNRWVSFDEKRGVAVYDASESGDLYEVDVVTGAVTRGGVTR